MFKAEKNIQAFEDETVLLSPIHTFTYTHSHTHSYTCTHSHIYIHTQTTEHCPSKFYGKMIFSLGFYVQAS